MTLGLFELRVRPYMGYGIDVRLCVRPYLGYGIVRAICAIAEWTLFC